MKYSALLGNPVEHSISPFLFRYLLELHAVEYAHLKITVPDEKELITTITKLYINILIYLKMKQIKYTQ